MKCVERIARYDVQKLDAHVAAFKHPVAFPIIINLRNTSGGGHVVIQNYTNLVPVSEAD